MQMNVQCVQFFNKPREEQQMDSYPNGPKADSSFLGGWEGF